MTKDFEFEYISDKGGRNENQDACDFRETGKNKCVCVVADGLGGYQGGSTAAKLAIKAVTDQAEHDLSFSQDGLRKLVEAAHNAIAIEQKKNKNLESMRSTIVVLVIHKNKALWIHCGDSRLYHIRNGAILSYTKDHSVPMMLYAAEEISLDEVRHHKDRNKIYQSLGGKRNELKPTVVKKMVEIQQNDIFLLCTDGFWEYVQEEEMESLWKGDLRQWLQSMRKQLLSKAAPGHDNYTACAVQVLSDDLTKNSSKLSNLLSLTSMKSASKRNLAVKVTFVFLSIILIWFSVNFFSGIEDPAHSSSDKQIIEKASVEKPQEATKQEYKEQVDVVEQCKNGLEECEEFAAPTDAHVNNEADSEEMDDSVKASSEREIVLQDDSQKHSQSEYERVFPRFQNFIKSAAQGDVSAQNELARICEIEYEVLQNTNEAEEWYWENKNEIEKCIVEKTLP